MHSSASPAKLYKPAHGGHPFSLQHKTVTVSAGFFDTYFGMVLEAFKKQRKLDIRPSAGLFAPMLALLLLTGCQPDARPPEAAAAIRFGDSICCAGVCIGGGLFMSGFFIGHGLECLAAAIKSNSPKK